jgi:hypothetical protein
MIGFIVLGLVLGVSGLGLVGSFGILSFLGMPILFVGLGLISAGVDPHAKEKYQANLAARATRP